MAGNVAPTQPRENTRGMWHQREGQYADMLIIGDKQHPVRTRKDRMGRRVERAGFAWERGKVVGQ